MSSESSSDEFEVELSWDETLQRIKENDPHVRTIISDGETHNMSYEELEELGRDIASNTHFVRVDLSCERLRDHMISSLFRGLTRSSSIEELNFNYNQFSAAGVRSMIPFLQTANSLKHLDLGRNNIQSEGFNVLLRALRDSPIEKLFCMRCGIHSIEIDTEHAPQNLRHLALRGNSINADGCRELAKLLQGGDVTLEYLYLEYNKIDDDGVEILVNALQTNSSLTYLDLRENDEISKRGVIMMLKLVNDISSIEATLQSNHTLKRLDVVKSDEERIHRHIYNAINISSNARSHEAAGREKVIQTQLNSEIRANFAALQGVNHSVYSEIDPLHLPEVLALVGRHHGQGELYIALKSSIADLISTVDRKECIRQQMTYYAARLKELGSELAAIEAAEGSAMSVGNEPRSIKKRRAC